mgnify:CR=1 FL=1
MSDNNTSSNDELPSWDIKDPETGKVFLTVQSENAPSPETVEYVLRQQNLLQVETKDEKNESSVEQLKKTNLENITDLSSEFMAGSNRQFYSLVDFMATPVRAVATAASMPFTDQSADEMFNRLSISRYLPQKGEFAGEGTATDIMSGAGEFTGLMVGGSPAQRYVSQAIAKGLETGTAKNVFELLGSGRSQSDILFGVSGGFGGESAAALASNAPLPENLKQNFEEMSRVAGQMITPAATLGLVNGVVNFSKNNLLKEAIPSTKALKAASSYIYTQLDELGVAISKKDSGVLSNRLTTFKDTDLINDPAFSSINNRINKLLISLKDGTAKFADIDAVRSELAAQSTTGDRTGFVAGKAAKIIDEAVLNMTAALPNRKNIRIEGELRSISDAVKTARELWRRSNTSKQLDDIYANAERRVKASRDDGKPNRAFEYEVRKDIAALLANDSQSIYLNQTEKKAMETFINGGSIENALGTLGNLSNVQGLAKGLLLTGAGSLIYSSYSSAGIPTAALAVGGAATLLYGVSSLLKAGSTQLLKQNGNLMKATIRAGNDSLGIAKAYLQNTPRRKQNSKELAMLLMRNNADLTALRESPVGRSSVGTKAIAMYDLFDRAVAQEEQEIQSQLPN